MPVKVTSAGKLETLPPRLDAAIRLGLHTAGMRVAGRARSIFTSSRPKGTATGATVRSITTSRVMKEGQYYRIRIGPSTPYAVYLHEKTPPQRPPPLRKIIEWLKVKPGTPPKDALYAVARAVQRRISIFGTEAFPFMEMALRLEGGAAVGIIKVAIIKELTR